MIKFRAWNKGTNRHLYNVQDAYDTLSGQVKDDPGENADYDEDCFGDFLNNNQYVVEQFSGLTDVRGKDIYEGDIVHYENDYEGTDDIGNVRFVKGRFCVWTRGVKTDVGEATRPEVIGNIHEHPELLAVDK